MKKVTMISLGLLLAASQVNAAAASDGIISFSGNISGQTCTISVHNGGNSNEVPLPKVSTAALNGENITAGTTRFTIRLSGCSTKTGNVYAYFEQGTNVNANGRLNNTGTATNVELQLLDSESAELNVGSADQKTVTTALTDGAATLSYAVRYYATGAATAGTVTSSVTYSIHYL